MKKVRERIATGQRLEIRGQRASPRKSTKGSRKDSLLLHNGPKGRWSKGRQCFFFSNNYSTILNNFSIRMAFINVVGEFHRIISIFNVAQSAQSFLRFLRFLRFQRAAKPPILDIPRCSIRPQNKVQMLNRYLQLRECRLKHSPNQYEKPLSKKGTVPTQTCEGFLERDFQL